MTAAEEEVLAVAATGAAEAVAMETEEKAMAVTAAEITEETAAVVILAAVVAAAGEEPATEKGAMGLVGLGEEMRVEVATEGDASGSVAWAVAGPVRVKASAGTADAREAVALVVAAGAMVAVDLVVEATEGAAPEVEKKVVVAMVQEAEEDGARAAVAMAVGILAEGLAVEAGAAG